LPWGDVFLLVSRGAADIVSMHRAGLRYHSLGRIIASDGTEAVAFFRSIAPKGIVCSVYPGSTFE
jgi:hypothetical protein